MLLLLLPLQPTWPRPDTGLISQYSATYEPLFLLLTTFNGHQSNPWLCCRSLGRQVDDGRETGIYWS